MSDVSLKSYYVVRPDEFAYVPVTSRNGEKISLARNNSSSNYICSSYVVFRVVSKEKLLPSYLNMYFERSEYNRYCRFHSWGSAREAFEREEMCEVKVPIPNIEIQEFIVGIYDLYLEREKINIQLKEQIKNCVLF